MVVNIHFNVKQLEIKQKQHYLKIVELIAQQNFLDLGPKLNKQNYKGMEMKITTTEIRHEKPQMNIMGLTIHLNQMK